ncbi:MAG: hypothetical protein RMI45_08915, partial [Ignisphaera sp.]|nr:hypothetical protein [Ignisphaera sp.]MDW8086338.1 hypothetical protein [Ignisphaera sp.]
RAFVAGALYELGVLRGGSSKHVLIEPSRSEAEIVSCFVGRVLGLGYAGSKGAEPSRYRLYVEPLNPVKPEVFANKYQRIRLLKMARKKRGMEGGEGEEGFEEREERGIEGLRRNYRFTLVVEKEREEYRDAEDLALKILIASLQLSGIGKGSRRGLGSLDIVGVEPQGFLGDAKNIGSFIEMIYSGIKNVVAQYAQKCPHEEVSTTSPLPLPPLPIISKHKTSSSQKSIELARVCKIDTRNEEDFIYIHNFFVRTQRCIALYGESGYKQMDSLRERRHAWFLGLPREGKVKRVRTGYLIPKEYRGDVIRRPSPIILAYHENGNVFGGGTYITILLSGDWPKKLVWTGETEDKDIDVDVSSIIDAYETFSQEFKKYLMRRNLKLTLEWPQQGAMVHGS